MSEHERLEWRISTASETGNCVSVAVTPDIVLVRHSRDTDGPVLSFTRSEWSAFLTGVRAGEFDGPAPGV